mmetsp:Transcript_21586/g.46488  ORF Transcript_21586/g.46488 Transcript_21586/m.46488 type:complete len:392 (-) Transcript_21586:236-1411(-)
MLSLLSHATAANVPIVTFDGATGTTFKFIETNDPVMGGQSLGTWTLDTDAKVGILDGLVKDVPSLRAPGFIKASADGSFPDLSSLSSGSLELVVKSSTPEYAGFHVTVVSGATSPAYACSGGGSIPFSRGCYKAPFSVPAGDDFTTISIPFSLFSDKWNPANGQQTTTCAEDPDVCITAAKLAAIQRVELWGEGVDGAVHLEVKSLTAIASAIKTNHALIGARPPAELDMCNGAVQENLKYNISSRVTPTVPVPVNADESLATAVCCDIRAQPFAEPRFTYLAPDIDLFGKLKSDEVTIFYDSVCGLPLFQAPVGRSFESFLEDTTEHGWPSFRPEEIFADNIITNKTSTYVTSKCGTHLGSFLPDEQGDRWCIDLVCVAGNAVSPTLKAA